MNIATLLHGIYPRSEELISATRAFDRQRIGKSTLTKTIASDRLKLIRLIQKLPIDYPNDGMLTHQDLFRALVESSTNMASGSLVRFFNTNTFFRTPLVAGKPILEPKKLSHHYPYDGHKHTTATLPSPLTFYALTHYTAKINSREKKQAINALIAGAIRYLVSHDFQLVILHEPFLVFDPERRKTAATYSAEVADLKEALRVIGGEIPLVLMTYFGDAAPVLAKLLRLPVQAVGIDCFETDLEDIKGLSFADKGAFLGVLDGRNSLVEEPRQIVSYVQKFISSCRPDHVYLGNNCSLEFVPQPIAEAKLEALKEAVKLLKKHYE